MAGRPKRSFFLNANVAIDTANLRYPEAAWDSEWHEVTGWRYYLDVFVDSAALEIGVGLCILADMVVTLSVLIWLSEEQAESLGIFVASAFLVLILFLDMVLRVLKEGRYFFYRPLNWVEFVVAVGGAGLMFWEASRRAGVSSGSASGAKGSTSLGRSIRPVMRVLRVLRATMQLLVSRGGIQGYADRTTDRLADRLIRDKLGDLLLVPPANITMKPSQGIFHLEKAQVRTRVFEGLHLPFTFKGGVIDLLHVDVDLVNSQAEKKAEKKAQADSIEGNASKTHRLLVILENVVFVAGPGHHQEPPAPSWDVEQVKEAKVKLVDLVTKRLGESGNKSKKARPATAGRQRRALIRWVQQRARMVVEEVLSHGMHMDFRNVELRYEDPEGVLLGGKSAIGGFHVDQLMLRGKGASQNNEVEDDLRSTGRWKHSKEDARPSPVVVRNLSDGTAVSSTSTSAFRFRGQTVKGTGSNASSQESVSAKRSLRHGILGCLSAQGAKLFWDVDIGAEAYADMLQEGGDMLKFSKKRMNWLMMERVRHQLCKELIRTFERKSPIQAARERSRKFKELIVGHRYILSPCGITIHASMRPMFRPGVSTWPPSIDIDVHVPAVNVSTDLTQLSSALHLVEYLQKWMREDRKLQWRVSAASGRGLHERVRARWNFAVLLVLQAIDTKYPWRSLAWMEMRRRTKLRREFVERLLLEHQYPHQKDPQRQRAILELQVAMPLGDCVFSKQEAQSLIASALLDVPKRNRQCLNCVFLQSPTDVVERSASAAGLPNDGEVSVDLSMDPFLDDKATESRELRDIASPRSPTSGALEVAKTRKCGQLSVVLESFEGFVMGHPMQDAMHLSSFIRNVAGDRPLRRPIMRCQVEGVRLLAGRQCPLPIWKKIAPGSAVSTVEAACWCKDAVPPGLVMEVTCRNVLAVFCAAPSSCPRLRRMFGVRMRHPRATWTDGEGNADRCSAGSPFAATRRFTQEKAVSTPPGSASTGSTRATFHRLSAAEMDRNPVRFNVAHMGTVDLDDVFDPLSPGNFNIRLQPDKKKKEGIYWQFAASFPALEGNVFMPVLKRIMEKVRKPPTNPFIRQETPSDDEEEGSSAEMHNHLAGKARWSMPGTLFAEQQRNSVDSAKTLTNAAHASDGEDVFFRDKMQQAFKAHRIRRKLPEKRIRQSEQLMGLSGVLQLSRFSGHVTIQHGIQGCVLHPYNMKTWFAQSTALPPGTVDVYRNSVPGLLSVAFSPSKPEEVKGGENGDHEGKGWEDECNAGSDALELEMQAAHGLPASAWRHRPSMSAHGLSLRVEASARHRHDSPEDIRISSSHKNKESAAGLCGLSSGCGDVCSGEKAACFVTVVDPRDKPSGTRQAHSLQPTPSRAFSPRPRMGLKAKDARTIAMSRMGGSDDVRFRGIGISVDILPSSALGVPQPRQLEDLWRILGL